MADTPILKIPVQADDDGSFEALLEKLDRLKQHMNTMPGGWKDHAQAVNQSGAALGGAFGQVQRFAKLADSSKMTGNHSFIFLFAKESKETEKSWFKITREVQTVQKSFENIARNAVTFGRYGLLGSLTGFGALGLGAYGLLSATDHVAGNLAGENQRNRSLGLKPGQEQAFDIDFQKYGLGSQDLQNMANAQADTKQWPWLRSLGFSQNDIQNGNPADLEIQAYQRAVHLARQWTASGKPLGLFMQTPQAHLFSADQLRTGLSYTDEDLARTIAGYPAEVQKQAINQKTLDEQTENWKKLSSALDSARRNLEAAFGEAFAGKITNVVDAFSKASVAFLKSDELKRDMDELADGFDTAVKAVKAFTDFVSPLLPSVGKGGDALDDTAIDLTKKGIADSKTLWQHIRNGDWSTIFGGIKSGVSAPDWHWDWRHPLGQVTHTAPPVPASLADTEAANDRKYGFPKGLQAAQADIESSGIPNIVNLNSGAEGLFQFMPDTAKRYGVDTMDPVSSANGAARYLSDLRKQFNGNLAKALAAYDGDTHINADSAKYGGNWLMGAKPETLRYLQKFQDRGVDIGLADSEKSYLQEQIKALKKAKTDADAAAKSSTPEYHQYFTMPQQQPQQQSSVAQAVRVALTVNTPAGSDVHLAHASMAGGYLG